MALSALQTKKIEEFNNHCLLALDFFSNGDYEHALSDFRKAGEAYMKIFILDQMGDNDGELYFQGKIDGTGRVVDVQQPQYQELLNLIWDKNILPKNKDIRTRLKDIKDKGNPSAHNPNEPIDFRPGAELAKSQTLELTNFLIDHKKIKNLNDLLRAFKGDIDHVLITELKQSPGIELYNYLDGFSLHNRYILIAPPTFSSCSSAQLEILSRIRWSFVLDFNPKSKEDGLYKAFEISGVSGFVPITIKQKGQQNLVGSGAVGNLNWLFANGLSGVPDTITNSIKSWRSYQYIKLIKEKLTEYFSKDVSQNVFIYLFDDIDLDYVEEVVRVIADIDFLPADLGKHVFIGSNGVKKDRILSFDKFDIEPMVFQISSQAFITQIAGSLAKSNSEVEKIIVPARTVSEENDILDISDIYTKLLDDDLLIVHIGIDSDMAIDWGNEVPPFYHGEQITWKGILAELDVKRSGYEDLKTIVSKQVHSLKKSMKFELQHKPGGGGTTTAYRLAFDLRTTFPVVVINSFDKNKSFKSLSLFVDRVKRNVLAIVEASNVDLNDLEELMRNCNANKLTVLFFYVKRSIRHGKQELSFFINDAMANIEERRKFLSKVHPFAKNKDVLKELEQRPASECEVIDFSLAISEDEYKQDRLVQYISAYINQMPEHHVKFTVFVSLIYRYAQKSVSDIIFRSLFKKTLEHELRQTPLKEQLIRKILIQEYDLKTHRFTEYWRPRFSKFAETVLIVVLGGGKPEEWKDHLLAYSLELIKLFKDNNPFLVDETRNLLRNVFVNRNNEDVLGNVDQWRMNGNNEQFSQVLKDIGVKEQQKTILKALVDAYPDQNHFLGHLGRFLYEKAEELAEFVEAAGYIQQAINTPDGEDDFNLHHLAGMCKRREIEFLFRQFKHGNASDITEYRLRELAEEANSYFNASITHNPYNIHAYVAQIQTLLEVIDFGRELSNIPEREKFLNEAKNYWYLEQFLTVKKLIEVAKILIENRESLGRTEKSAKARRYINMGEARSFDVIGDFGTSSNYYLKLLETAERSFRPQLRIMAVYSTLLSKVKGNKRNINLAWGQLRPEEIKYISELFSANILQDPGNLLTLRLWFNFVRYSYVDIVVEDVIAKLMVWYDQSEEDRIMHLEAAYYLYILHACLVISAGESFSLHHKTQANYFIEKCRAMSTTPKYSFEFLGDGLGLDSLINHRDRNLGDDSMLKRVQGTITKITSRQQGLITLDSGLEAFFVPVIGGFIEGKHETTKVSFFIGFRHDGLFAISVKEIIQLNLTKPRNEPVISINEEEFDQIIAIEDIDEEKIEKEVKLATEPPMRIKHVIEGPKVKGKIDLDTIRGHKEKSRFKKK